MGASVQLPVEVSQLSIAGHPCKQAVNRSLAHTQHVQFYDCQSRSMYPGQCLTCAKNMACCDPVMPADDTTLLTGISWWGCSP